MSYGLLLRKKGTQQTTMDYFVDEQEARRGAAIAVASGLYSLVELIEFRRLSRWENHD
jgi:hypothetical protein